MSEGRASGTSGIGKSQRPLTAEARDQWLAIGAPEKARSIIELAGRDSVRTVLEVGAGTGAVLQELDTTDFAGEYWACEPSADLYELLTSKRIPRLVAAYPTTLEESPAASREFDLVYVSHVLEHVLAPAALLAMCLRLAPRVVLEVPLEANLGGQVRTALLRRPRWPNSAGHIHFFSRRSAHLLVSYAGGEVVRAREYFPHASYEWQARDPLRRAVAQTARIVPTLGRLYYAHLALLVTSRTVDISEANPAYFNPGGPH
jgi:SAM-dependent methyltransferase